MGAHLCSAILVAAEYKAESVVTPTGAIPFPTRTVYNRHGVRILVAQSGRIGRFSFQVSPVASPGWLATCNGERMHCASVLVPVRPARRRC